MLTIDEIKIEGEEDGFHLVIYTDDDTTEGANSEAFRFRIGLPDQFHAETVRTIGRWLAEGEGARVTIDLTGENWKPIAQGDGPWTHVSVEYDPEDSGIEITNPKHPDYHDTMSGIHDNREGK